MKNNLTLCHKGYSHVLFFLLVSFFASGQEGTIEPPVTTSADRCGAGIVVLRAASPLDGQDGVLYNWYHWVGNTLTLIESIETGVFVTPNLIASKTYYVSVSHGGEESKKSGVSATIRNTARILENPIVSLCDSVILEAQVSFSASELSGATYQWQKYEVSDGGEGEYVDLEDPTSSSGLTYKLFKSGFYRVVITRADGCQAISESVEVTLENVINATILYNPRVCFIEGTPKSVVLQSEFEREITSYQWEESTDSISFYPIGTESSITRTNPTPLGHDSSVRYYRLTLTEETCSMTSEIVKQTWYRLPEGQMTHLGSTDDFFYCHTDPEVDRILRVSADRPVMFTWLRLQKMDGVPLDIIRTLGSAELLGEFSEVGQGDSLILEEGDWGRYVVHMYDPVSGCDTITNFMFVDSAIPDFEFSSDAVCTNLTEVTLAPYDDEADSYSWSYAETEGGSYAEIGADASFVVAPDATVGAGWYNLSVIKNGCAATYVPDYLIEEDIPRPTISVSDPIICPSASVTLSSSIASSEYTYEWHKDVYGDSVLSTDPSYEALGPGEYTLDFYGEFCGYRPEALHIEAYVPPSDSLLGIFRDSAYCQKLTLELSEQLDGYTYQWYYGLTGSFDPLGVETATIRTDSIGSYFVRTTSADGCSTNSDTVEVLGLLDPSLSVSEDLLVLCGPTPRFEVTANPDSSATYSWYYKSDITDTYALISSGINAHTLIIDQAGIYQLQLTTDACTASSNELQVVNEPSFADFEVEIVGENLQCGTTDIVLYNTITSAEVDYRWQYHLGDGEYVEIGSNTDSLMLNQEFLSSHMTVDSLMLYVRLEVKDDVCWDLSEDFELKIYKDVAVQIVNTATGSIADANFCTPADPGFALVASHTLDSIVPDFQWQQLSNDSLFENVSMANSDRFVPATPGVYRCQLMYGAGACTIVSNDILVSPILNSGLLNADSLMLCGESAQALLEADANTGATYYWQYRAAITDPYDTLTVALEQNTLTVDMQGLYRAGIEKNGCVVSTKEVFLEVNPSAEGLTVTIDGATSACYGDGVLLQSNYSSASAIYEWSYSLDQVSFERLAWDEDSLYLDSVAADSLLAGDSAQVSLLLKVVEGSCEAVSSQIDVLLYNEFVLEIKGPDDVTDEVLYCGTEDLGFLLQAFTERSADAIQYQWQRKEASGAYHDIPLAKLAGYQPDRPGTYRCVGLLGASECQSVSNEINVIAVPSGLFTPAHSLCEGTPLEMLVDTGEQSAEVLSRFDLTWYHAEGGGDYELIDGASTDMLIVESGNPIYNDGSFYYILSNDQCEVKSDTVHFYIEPVPEIELITENATCQCVENGSALVKIADSVSQYTYTLNDTLDQQEPFFEGLTAGFYEVRVVSSLGCRDSLVFEISYNEELDLTVANVPAQRPGVPFQLIADGADHYQWAPEAYFLDTLGATATALIPEGTNTDTVMLVVNGWSDLGCEASRVVRVPLLMDGKYTFSRLISPNGDGYNDYFEILGLSSADGYLSVFDNWGREIFSASGYTNGSADAKRLNDLLKEGTYFYIFKMTGTVYKGSFYFKP